MKNELFTEGNHLVGAIAEEMAADTERDSIVFCAGELTAARFFESFIITGAPIIQTNVDITIVPIQQRSSDLFIKEMAEFSYTFEADNYQMDGLFAVQFEIIDLDINNGFDRVGFRIKTGAQGVSTPVFFMYGYDVVTKPETKGAIPYFTPFN